ncbi:MAG TPA: cytochrome d ubiquinol oxidase subunit II [Gammaproteobacteria bacterium]|nr:cytochrome d ubiquinol oxidase subunit II [Gammaproteobacteria bacterium]
MDLPLIWAGIIAFGVTMYVLLDGFSLGVGILFPFVKDDDARDLMMGSVVPVWDGNQTWLVLGGTSLFAAFPEAFSLLLSILYLPLIVMLIALVFRGVAFEFRFKAERHEIWRTIWDLSFIVGCVTAAFCQGLVLGAYVLGFNVEGRTYAGGVFDWLSPFSLMTGVAVVCGYALLGACWLLIKTEGHLQHWARQTAVRLLVVMLAFVALVSIWTPLADPDIAQRWFSWPNLLYLSPVPVLTGIVAFGFYNALRKGSEHAPFVLCVVLYLLTLAGLAVSLWPYIVPRSLTIWQVASPPESQIFLLVGVAIIIPIILLYTANAYYVFRGKVKAEDMYH